MAPGRVVLLTGVPAAGKTTLAAELARVFSRTNVVHFGRFILEVVADTTPGITEQQLRSAPSQFVTSDVLDAARSRLVRYVRTSRKATNVIIDSHAVALDEYGFRITPDSVAYLKKLALDAVVVVRVPHDVVVQRIEEKPEGRRPVSLDTVAAHQSLQEAVAVAYGVATGAPVVVVDIGVELAEGVASVARALRAVGMGLSAS